MDSMTKLDMNGIVLIGGQSHRMGRPKACIEINGEKLALRTAKLLNKFTSEVYLSGREDQLELIEDVPYSFISDNYRDIGPIAGILSVFEFLKDTNNALLFAATDMPFLDEPTLKKLIQHRNPHKTITLFQQEQSGFLEPLCAIYEPGAYPKIKASMEKGIYAIHKIFAREEMETISYNEKKPLTNINFPDQLEYLT